MCRLLAYLGDEILLSSLFLDPEHSLEKQAWNPKELRETNLNADGYGFAWYNSGHTDARCYRHTLPVWNDANLSDLSHSLSRPLWLAYIRSATPGLGLSIENTQPFIYRHWSFIHNGYIYNFRGKTQHAIREQLEEPFSYLIQGNTDSEYIFALLMQLLESQPPQEALASCVSIIKDLIKTDRALLNIAISDGTSIYAIKYAVNGLCPTLYYTSANTEFGDNNQIITSEPLNSENTWLKITDYSVISLQPHMPAETINL